MMNFPYVLSDEILLHSKYEKKMEKKKDSKWLPVTIKKKLYWKFIDINFE